MLQGGELAGRLGTAAYLGADCLDPVHDLAVELFVPAHGVIDLGAPLDQARQDFVDIGNGEGIVHAIDLHCPFLPGQAPVPEFELRVAFLTEQHSLSMLSSWN